MKLRNLQRQIDIIEHEVRKILDRLETEGIRQPTEDTLDLIPHWIEDLERRIERSVTSLYDLAGEIEVLNTVLENTEKELK